MTDSSEEANGGGNFPAPICDITVRLTGQDGNAFYILSRVVSEMNRADVDAETVEAFRKEATSGDYDHLILTVLKYVNVE